MPDPLRLAVTRGDFPEGFVFGAATSAYQIEGAGFGGAGRCHWDDFAATPGNVIRGENGAVACDHYHRWPGDLDLVRDAGLDAYRFSISWARVMPEGRGAANPDGIAFYDRLLDGILARGLQPWATLYHWELPSPLADLGGWRNRDIAGWFADYTEAIMRRLGDRIHATAPINEPWCVAWLSHFLGAHAPGLRDIRAAARAMHHVGLAHGRAIGAMRGLGMRNLGAVLNFEFAAPADASAEARAAATLYDGIYNRWFAGGMLRGAYPDDVLAGIEPHLAAGWQDDLGTIAANLDWVGVNYYTRKCIAQDSPALWPGLREVPGPLPKTDMGWEIYPEGLFHILTWLNREAGGRLPIYVTENGMASATPHEDVERIAFLAAHLEAARRASRAGVPLRGYFVWSLLDNYEWALGYAKRFGLVHVDFATQERRPKASWRALRQALARC